MRWKHTISMDNSSALTYLYLRYSLIWGSSSCPMDLETKLAPLPILNFSESSCDILIQVPIEYSWLGAHSRPNATIHCMDDGNDLELCIWPIIRDSIRRASLPDGADKSNASRSSIAILKRVTVEAKSWGHKSLYLSPLSAQVWRSCHVRQSFLSSERPSDGISSDGKTNWRTSTRPFASNRPSSIA